MKRGTYRSVNDPELLVEVLGDYWHWATLTHREKWVLYRDLRPAKANEPPSGRKPLEFKRLFSLVK